MRDYSKINQYLNELAKDVYSQPDDDGHIELAIEAVNQFSSILKYVGTVLDVGCGEGYAQDIFMEKDILYQGITLGEDVQTAKELGRNVREMDFSFLDFPDESADLIWSRHSLEHSPMPLLTLMEWHRVGRVALILILPNPEHYSWSCPNHYGIMYPDLAKTLCARAGWKVIKEHYDNKTEFRILCEKSERSYEFKRFHEEEEDKK